MYLRDFIVGNLKESRVQLSIIVIHFQIQPLVYLYVDVHFDMCTSEYKSLIGLHVVCICNLVTLKG